MNIWVSFLIELLSVAFGISVPSYIDFVFARGGAPPLPSSFLIVFCLRFVSSCTASLLVACGGEGRVRVLGKGRVMQPVRRYCKLEP